MLETASVAMAVYNGERFLEQQIDSILEQLSSDDELVISYDESQDGTLSLISRGIGKQVCRSGPIYPFWS